LLDGGEDRLDGDSSTGPAPRQSPTVDSLPVVATHPIQGWSAPRFAVVRIAELAADDKNSNAFAFLAIDHGVEEVMQHVNSSNFVHRRAKSRKFDPQRHNSVELVHEAAGEPWAASWR
jgi:hypothetical protein